MKMKLYCLMKQAQDKDNEAVINIINMFSPKLKKSLLQTSLQEREDLEQDLVLKMIDIIYQYNLESTPGFWEFREMVNR